MGKLLALCFILFLALASATSYLVLTRFIDAGEREITQGQKQLERGQRELQAGQAKLANGKRELSTLKQVHSLPLMGLTILNPPAGAMAYLEAKQKIAAGNKQIAVGEVRVRVGKQRLAAGKLRLSQGEKELQMAQYLRKACAIAAILFTLLALGLGFHWRRKKTKPVVP